MLENNYQLFLTQMYNTNQRERTTGTPSSPGGTKYFNHFPSNFLHPYGLAGAAPDHETLQRRINPICCEWLKRPHIAMSEFAATIVDNFNFLATNGNAFINTDLIDEKRHNCKTFLEALANLNTKNLQWSPRPEHVHTVMETVYNDLDPMHEMMSQFFKIGGSMFVMAVSNIS